MQITEKQKQQLIDLNDSRVNEILELGLGLKVGEWYKDIERCGTGYYCIKSITDGTFRYYGFSIGGVWHKNDWYFIDSCNLEKATKQEVEETLINEAKRRGFKEGVKFKCLISAEVGVLIEDYFLYNGSFGRGNSLESAFKNDIINGVLFKEGQWAEIIDEKTELKQEIKELEVKLKESREKL